MNANIARKIAITTSALFSVSSFAQNQRQSNSLGDGKIPSVSPDGAPSTRPLPVASQGVPEVIDLKQRSIQMGIDPRQFSKFWEEWDLVNVRYRTSPSEQRFVYANDVAWQTLKSGGTKFKEGAVLGKIAFMVGFDHRFPSSYQATSFSRIQLMKKDSKKYKETDGWGYALYLNVPDEKNKFGLSDAQACHACHKLAGDHDFVFSTPVFGSSTKFVSSGAAFFENFKLTTSNKIPAVVLQLVQGHLNRMPSAILDYEITAFQGTISESMLPVSRLATERDVPVLLRSTDGVGFVLAMKVMSPETGCKIAAKVWVKDMQIIPGQPPSDKPREQTYCDGVFK